VLEEHVTFVQPGTPTGTMLAHGFTARVTGGAMLDAGPEGTIASYRLDALPRIVPVRVANQRVLDAYLERRTPHD
jgi:hypothetical protein